MNKPLAAEGLISYRYRGRYGWVMIGAKDHDDALSEAGRSIAPETPVLSNLQIWDGFEYVAAELPPIVITRTQNYPRPARPGAAWVWLYSVTVPGQPYAFTGEGIGWARRIAKQHAAKGQEIQEAWKQ